MKEKCASSYVRHKNGDGLNIIQNIETHVFLKADFQVSQQTSIELLTANVCDNVGRARRSSAEHLWNMHFVFRMQTFTWVKRTETILVYMDTFHPNKN